MSGQVLGEEARRLLAEHRLQVGEHPDYDYFCRAKGCGFHSADDYRLFAAHQVDMLTPHIAALIDQAHADERKRWQILNDAWARVVSKYTYAPGPGGNVERVAQLGADDMRPALVEWLRQQYRGFDAARGRS